MDDIYNQVCAPGEESYFTEKALDHLNVKFDIAAEDLARIPRVGPVIVVANHPFGALEGMLLAALLKTVRPDFKILANFLLARIPEMRPLIISVDPFGGKDAPGRNIAPMKEAVRLVQKGGLLAMFPAGEVSHLNFKNREITDPQWTRTVARIIRMTQAPILPLYFDGNNSLLFQVAGLIHKRLRTALLPRELLNKRNRRIPTRVGNLISFERMNRIGDDHDLVEYIRMRTYLLSGRADSIGSLPSATDGGAGSSQGQKPIPPPDHNKLLAEEVSHIPEENIMAHQGDYLVFRARMEEIPLIIREIGRLRELTFRQVGEGTGKALDLDRFDTHYLHLFAWNKEKKQIVGAYRLGTTDTIMDRFGVKGLYTSTLFKFREPLLTQISPAIELGRSFIRPEYQKEFAPLNLLWKGVGRFIVENPRYKMLFGPVSINNRYHSISRRLLVGFLTLNNFNTDLARLVKPKTPPKVRQQKRWDESAVSRLVSEVNEIDDLISEIQADRMGIPILLKHYLKLGGRLLGFNIDPDFSDVLDGLILVDLRLTPRRILEKYMGREGLARFLEYDPKSGGKDAKFPAGQGETRPGENPAQNL